MAAKKKKIWHDHLNQRTKTIMLQSERYQFLWSMTKTHTKKQQKCYTNPCEQKNEFIVSDVNINGNIYWRENVDWCNSSISPMKRHLPCPLKRHFAHSIQWNVLVGDVNKHKITNYTHTHNSHTHPLAIDWINIMVFSSKFPVSLTHQTGAHSHTVSDHFFLFCSSIIFPRHCRCHHVYTYIQMLACKMRMLKLRFGWFYHISFSSEFLD